MDFRRALTMMMPLIASVALGVAHANAADPSPAPAAEATPVTTKSGLQYSDVKVGTGATPKQGQSVTVNYTISVNGKKVEGSTSVQPLGFTLGKNQTLKAIEEGVSTMKVGGQRKLLVPPDLAYGQDGVPGRVPPNTPLNIDLELLAVH